MTIGILIMFTLLWIGVSGLLKLIFAGSDSSEDGTSTSAFFYVVGAIIVFISAPYLPEGLYEFFRF